MNIETTTLPVLIDFGFLPGDDKLHGRWDGEPGAPAWQPTEALDGADHTADPVIERLEAEAAEAQHQAELAAVWAEIAAECDEIAASCDERIPTVWGPATVGAAFRRMRTARRKAGLPKRPVRDEGTAPAKPSTPTTGSKGKGKAKARRRPAKRQGQRTDGQLAAERSAATARVSTLCDEGWSLAAHHVGPRVETWLLARDGERTKVEAPVATKAKARRGRRPARRR